MAAKLIYRENHAEQFLKDTWVELIGEGNYAILQSGTGAYKKLITNVIYLSRKQIEEILKEQEINIAP